MEKGFVSGFVALGFAIFIAGFLIGILAIAVLSLSIDATNASLMFFAAGLIIGVVPMALLIIRMRATSKDNLDRGEGRLSKAF